MRRLLSRSAAACRALFRKAAVERDLDDELAHAAATLEQRYRAGGMTPPQARRAARLALGGVEPLKEEIRQQRAGAGIESLALDLRHAARALRKASGFSAIVVITLALGIGANAAIYSVVHALLLAPLPYRDASRLDFIWSDMTDGGYPRAPLSGPELADLRARSTTHSGFGAIWANTRALTGDGEPEQLRVGLVTSNFFDVLGADAGIGRTFRPEDGAPGARPSIVLGWPLFERRYGADRSIVGRQILVNDRPATVLGVMPKSFRLLLPADASVPDDLQAFLPFPDAIVRGPRGQQYLRVIGRMKPGVTLAQARADVSAIAARISTEFSDYGASGRILNTVALQEDGVREMRPALLALFAGVGILLAIACVNVASLLIARAVSRAHEVALKLALGASRFRVLRQSACEGLLLALLALAAGVPTGIVMLRLLVSLRPETLSRIEMSRFDPAVMGFTAAVAIAWGVVFALAPGAEILKVDAGPSLQRQGRTAGLPIRYRARAALVVVQVALSVVLLVGAALLARAFVAVQQVDPGFRSDGVLTFRLAFPFQRLRDGAAVNAFSRQLQTAIAALPGVTAAGAISHLPYDDLPNWGGGFVSETAVDRTTAPTATYRAVTPGLFETLGVRVVEGRTFTDADQDPRNPVAVVDDRLAHRLWPGGAVGRHLVVDPASNGIPSQVVTVIGVVPHLRLRSLVADFSEEVFFPHALVRRSPMAFVVRTGRDPASVAADVRRAVAAIDPKVPIYDVRPLDEYVANAVAMRRFTTQLAATFAVVALVLACIGVYGVMAYAVTRRRREFGIRLALGAEPRRVLGEVMTEGLRLTFAGIALGVGVALATSHLLQAQLYGVRARDPLSYTATLILLVAAAAIACFVPARRATAVTPMEALRAE